MKENKINLNDSISSYSIFLEKYASIEKFEKQDIFYRNLYSRAFNFVNKIIHPETNKKMKKAAEKVLERALKEDISNFNELRKLYENKIPETFYPSNIGGGMLTKEGIKKMLKFYEDKEARLLDEIVALNHMLT